MASTQPIVLVVVCARGLVFLYLLTFALFCFFKKGNEKTQETNIIHIDEHKKGKETITPDETRKKEKLDHGLHAKSSSAIIHIDEHKKGNKTIVPGPFGQQAVVISVEDDLHIIKARKNEKHGHGLHAKPSSAEANHRNSNNQ
ncbi:unnamed protein product [Vicia faba]|uniref:Uncharacterized protein n=1 Tax=Vicia faba TaxID=3906 RepID=A0AAV1A7W8_VICFA|nr:unnamed protein product [Vicia faba]